LACSVENRFRNEKHVMDEKVPSLPPSLKKIDDSSKAIVECIVSTFH
jgi:hypothetical protein